MKWTTVTDIRAQIDKLWNRGSLLACLCEGENIFPLRLTVKGPDSKELSERFSEVQSWIARLKESAKFFRIEWKKINHRIVGTNEIPSAIWIDSLDDALRLTGRREVADQFIELVKITGDKQPKLLTWLAKRPLRALEIAKDWPQLLLIVDWLIRHNRPGVYLRQIDLPGIHTKFIEGYRNVLIELLDIVLPETAIDKTSRGITGFCRRYGFLDKPLRARFRVLDQNIRLLSAGSDQDITVTEETFSALQIPVSKVFITENEINFLAFPVVADAILIFGAGYGFNNLSSAQWLHHKKIYYWGDIDTHGFAILNQLRGILPDVKSFLMDTQTLLGHRELWGFESNPEKANLARLTPEETKLYDQLRNNHWGENIRLEQERVGFKFLTDVLEEL
ncbi:MAG: hypothetical protein JW927_22145 [Deltaproteobacteria bacterium]|nr:hypothetical protein [Deltaproteobacteria bacterium]